MKLPWPLAFRFCRVVEKLEEPAGRRNFVREGDLEVAEIRSWHVGPNTAGEVLGRRRYMMRLFWLWMWSVRDCRNIMMLAEKGTSLGR